jgi:hypothetical protein
LTAWRFSRHNPPTLRLPPTLRHRAPLASCSSTPLAYLYNVFEMIATLSGTAATPRLGGISGARAVAGRQQRFSGACQLSLHRKKQNKGRTVTCAAARDPQAAASAAAPPTSNWDPPAYFREPGEFSRSFTRTHTRKKRKQKNKKNPRHLQTWNLPPPPPLLRNATQASWTSPCPRC